MAIFQYIKANDKCLFTKTIDREMIFAQNNHEHRGNVVSADFNYYIVATLKNASRQRKPRKHETYLNTNSDSGNKTGCEW